MRVHLRVSPNSCGAHNLLSSDGTAGSLPVLVLPEERILLKTVKFKLAAEC